LFTHGETAASIAWAPHPTSGGMSLVEVGTCQSQGGCIPRALGDSLETPVSTATIVLIIVIVLIVVALIGLAAWMSNKKKMEHRRAEAERIRQEAAAHEGGLQESQVRAREAEVEAEQARLQAQRAEEEAARAHQGVSQERALHEDKLREADRLDPNVDHRAEGYNPDTRATETSAPAYDETGRVDPATTRETQTTGTAGTTGTTAGTTGTTGTSAGTTGTTGTTRVDEQGRPVDENGRPIEDPSEPGGTHRAP
jgi:hypothetical protein